MTNPLLDFSGAIAFDRITPADVAPPSMNCSGAAKRRWRR